MMRKLLFVIFLFSLLVSCAPAATPEPTATKLVGPAVADQSLATPAYGGVTVLPIPGKSSLALYSRPDPQSAAVGSIKPGERGRLLGLDASGLWMLVEINKQTGWAPVQFLDYLIAE